MNITHTAMNFTNLTFITPETTLTTIYDACRHFDNEFYKIILVLAGTWLFLFILLLIARGVKNERLEELHGKLETVFHGVMGVPLCYMGFNYIIHKGYITTTIYNWLVFIGVFALVLYLYASYPSVYFCNELIIEAKEVKRTKFPEINKLDMIKTKLQAYIKRIDKEIKEIEKS